MGKLSTAKTEYNVKYFVISWNVSYGKHICVINRSSLQSTKLQLCKYYVGAQYIWCNANGDGRDLNLNEPLQHLNQ